MEIDEKKDALLGAMEEDQSYTVHDLCRLLKTQRDFDVVMSISELEDEGQVIGDEDLQIYREDGGAILLARYRLS